MEMSGDRVLWNSTVFGRRPICADTFPVSEILEPSLVIQVVIIMFFFAIVYEHVKSNIARIENISFTFFIVYIHLTFSFPFFTSNLG